MDLYWRDRHQLGAVVAGSVACAWIYQWLAATETGDDDAAAEAVRCGEALRRARDWPILVELAAVGDYSAPVQQYADAVASGDRRTAASARRGLGCGQEG